MCDHDTLQPGACVDDHDTLQPGAAQRVSELPVQVSTISNVF